MGTHRSGTSCLATLLGSHPKFDASSHSYGEDQGFVLNNRAILDDNKSNWRSPPLGKLTPSAQTKQRMRTAIDGWLYGDETRVLKDPRTCLTLPVWLEALPEDEVALVVILRPPLDSVKSLMASNAHKCKEEKLARDVTFATLSAMFWNVAAADAPKTFVLYEELLRRPAETMAPVCEMLGIMVEELELGLVNPELQTQRRPISEGTD